MTRPLRVGDRVTATGTVSGQHPSGVGFYVKWDGYDECALSLRTECLTLIAPAEPPVGSVVVKDGASWQRGMNNTWFGYPDVSKPATGVLWDDISDGEILWTPGGDA